MKAGQALRMGALAVLIAMLAAYGWLRLSPPTRSIPIDRTAVAPVQGFAYYAPLKLAPALGYSATPDSNTAATVSSVVVTENGKRLGPAHATHDAIFSFGAGRFSHWGDTIIFSASDNSDPRSNGRTYAAVQDFVVPGWLDAVAALVLLAALAVGRAWRWPAPALRLIRKSPVLSDPKMLAGAGAAILLVLSAVQVLRPTLTSPIAANAITASDGKAYVVKAPWRANVFLPVLADDNTHPLRSTARVIENGVELQRAHAYHPDIASQGGGLYSHWGEEVVFSSTDGSDLRSNGRSYALTARPEIAGWIWMPALLLALALLLRAAAIHPSFQIRARRVSGVEAFCFALAVLAAGAAVCDLWSVTGFAVSFSADSGSYFSSPAQRGYLVGMVLGMGQALGIGAQWPVVIQLLLFTLGAFLLGRSVGRIVRSPAAGWLLTAVLFCDTELIRELQILLSEPLFFALLMIHVAFGLDALRSKRAQDFAICAAAAALAMLVRPAGYSLLVGLLAIALMMRPWSWRRVAPGAGAFVALIVAGATPNLINHRIFATHIFGGVSLLGHVVQLADKQAHYDDPELADAVIDATANISTAKTAPYPDGYWRATVNEFNTLLWLHAAPTAQALIDKRIAAKPVGSPPADVNAMLDAAMRKMAVTIILAHPLDYAQQVTAQLYGMWESLFLTSGPFAMLMPDEAKGDAALVAADPGLQKLVGGSVYPPADVAARWSKPVQPTGLDAVWDVLRPTFRLLNWPMAALTFVLCFLALGAVVTKRELGVALAACCFCAIQIWCCNGLIALTQPALGRYAQANVFTVLTILTIGFATGVAWLRRRQAPAAD